jgi:hypothetical protein
VSVKFSEYVPDANIIETSTAGESKALAVKACPIVEKGFCCEPVPVRSLPFGAT